MLFQAQKKVHTVFPNFKSVANIAQSPRPPLSSKASPAVPQKEIAAFSKFLTNRIFKQILKASELSCIHVDKEHLKLLLLLCQQC